MSSLKIYQILANSQISINFSVMFYKLIYSWKENFVRKISEKSFFFKTTIAPL